MLVFCAELIRNVFEAQLHQFLSRRTTAGQIPSAQLEAFARIIKDQRLGRRFVFVLTHHAPRLEDGSPDHYHHGLIGADDFLGVCAGVPRGAILFGHVHRRYVVREDGVPPPMFCAGSTTQAGSENLWVYDINDGDARATPGRWAEDRYVLDHESAVEV